jgi:hypothetical protein
MGRLEGETFTVMSRNGKELWHKNFPDGFWPDYYRQGLESRTWFGDLNGDGITEVLLLYHPAKNPTSHSTTLICFSDRGNELWRWTPGRALPELDGGPAFFKTEGFEVLKASEKRGRRIVVTSHHQLYYPNQVSVVDPDGKTVSEYWHSGFLDHLALASLDDGAHEEIIVTGISNGYHQATLIVLDPDKVEGASVEAARPEIQIHGMGVPHERLRLLFPRSDLNKDLSIYNVSQEVVIGRARIRFSVKECWLRPEGCNVWYDFDRSFRLISAIPDDQFRSAHKEFYLGKKADHPFSAAEESQFQKVRCLVGCEGEFVQTAIR